MTTEKIKYLATKNASFDSLPPLDVIVEACRDIGLKRAQHIERRILAGENDFMVDNIRYQIPAWRRHPVRRFRVAWARRSASRSS